MIQKISKTGAGFRGALDYVLAARKQPELIGGNMAGETARQLAKELGQGRALNQAGHKPGFHASLTGAPEDWLGEDRWRRGAPAHPAGLGDGGCPGGGLPDPGTANEHRHS